MAAATAGLTGGKFVDGTGKVIDVEQVFADNDVVGLYFSAHWCPPCRGFTPMLIETYKALKSQNKSFEVIFVSSDQDQEAFEGYFNDMPWKALEFGSEIKQGLSNKYGVRGIPSLVLLNKDGTILREDGRMVVHMYKDAAYPFTKEAEKEAADAQTAQQQGV